MKHLFTLFLSLTAWTITHAQIFVKHDATGTNDGSSWENAFTDLQDALDAAATGTQVWVAAGTYKPSGPTPDSSHFVPANAVEIYGGFAGTETQLSERDWTNNPTILSGDLTGDDTPGNFTANRTDNAHHILIVDNSGATTILDGLTFIGGMTRIDAFNPGTGDLPYNRWRAGALYVRSSVVLRNSAFQDNHGHQGSALYALPNSLDDTIHIENTLFEANNSNGGGTCYISGWNTSAVKDCVFRDNLSANFGAGLTVGNSNVAVSDSHFENNQSTSQGGAIFLFQNANITIPDPAITIKSCTLTDNIAGTGGGGINFNVFFQGFSLTIDSCSFIHNTVVSAEGSGGAFQVIDFPDGGTFDAQSVRLQNSHFENNSSDFGGAVACLSGDDSLSVNLTHVTIQNNEASLRGGGMYADMGSDAAALNLTCKSLTLKGNLSLSGGGGATFLNIAANGRFKLDIDSSLFDSNSAKVYAGALEILGPSGTVRSSTFIRNDAVMSAGAFIMGRSDITLDGCHFVENHTEGSLAGFEGGGAGLIWTGQSNISKDVIVRNSIFNGNTSNSDAGALLILDKALVHCDNLLLFDNHGASAISNRGTLSLLNTTIADNDFGLSLRDSSQTELQNTLLQNDGTNLITVGSFSILSKGGNLSSDASAEALLTGSGFYDDLHNLDPLLDPAFIPLPGSPCIDAGNPSGITALYDLAGNPRISGKSVDIGSYESMISAVRNEIAALPLHVYPNPVTNLINVQLTGAEASDLTCYVHSTDGKQTYAIKLDAAGENTYQQHVGHIPGGEYLLSVYLKGIIYAAPIAVVR